MKPTTGKDILAAVYDGTANIYETHEPPENPKGWVYGIRHHSEDWDQPISVERFVCVNRWGFLVMEEAIIFPAGKDYIELTEIQGDELRECARQEPIAR